ncbi:hypothetical protein [Nesterenkonia salmonea]|nr:hypothetical protein [Nesterenkonia salmonea]
MTANFTRTVTGDETETTQAADHVILATLREIRDNTSRTARALERPTLWLGMTRTQS